MGEALQDSGHNSEHGTAGGTGGTDHGTGALIEAMAASIDEAAHRKIGRREFVLGAAGATLAIIGTTAILTGCSTQGDGSAGDSDAQPTELSVAEGQVVNSSDFTEVPMADCVAQTASIDLPMGSLCFKDCDDIVAVLTPGEAADVLVQIGMLGLSSGTFAVVVPRAVGYDEGYQIYDARSSDHVMAWVESNPHTDEWRVYLAPVVSSAEIGTPVLADQGDADFDLPQLAVCGQQALWTVMPDEQGAASDSDSYLKSAIVANVKPGIVYTSHGRMISAPEVADGIVTIVPRAETKSARYQMTAIDVATGTVVDAQILPSSMRVCNAVYLDGAFVFGIENNYDFGGGISRFGTYTDIGNDTYMRFARTPLDTPARVGDYLLIKSTKSVVGVNTAKQAYFAIDTVPGCEDYGDFLLSRGTDKQIVTYTTVPTGDGSGTGLVRVRAFSTL